MTKIIQFMSFYASGTESAAASRGLKLSLLLAALAIVPTASGQALPTAEASPISTGFTLPVTEGSLQYAVSASESLYWGFFGNAGKAASTNVSGDVAYISSGKRNPFSMVLSGGHSWSTSGQSSFNFVNLGVSQVANVGRWTFVLSDGVDYLPSTPTTGLAGIPGFGDLGLNPIAVGGYGNQGVLTNYSNRVDNNASASVSRQITGKTSLNAGGTYGITRFVNNSSGSSNGLDSDSKSGSGGLNHQFNVRNSIGANYSYSNYSYIGSTYGIAAPDIVSQTGSLQYTHQFTRKLGMSASAGPQWTTVDFLGKTTSLSLFADVAATYAGKLTHSSLTFVRSTNSGYGVIGGALSNSVSFTASRTFARVWNGALVSAYSRTSSLPLLTVPSHTFDTTVVGVQVSRALARSLSAYASYTLENQSTQGPAALAIIDVFSGRSQVASFGITYSPMSLHVGRP